MTTNIAQPFVHVEDSNGIPHVGAQLFVYTVNTTTLASIYSDTALSVALTNPMVSDASGNFARAYIAAGQYKLRAETSAGVLIWQHDYNDTGLGFAGGPLAIASGGTAATTAAAALTALGAASAASVTSLASDIAGILTTLQQIVTVPQGYLTPTSSTPVIVTGVTAGTSLYYTPYRGNLVPIYDGTQFNIHDFAELTLTLNANHTANSIYDVFTFLEAGVPIIGTGPTWNTVSAGAGARGTGAGSTELTRTNGLWTNTNSITLRNGATTYTVDAKKATYLGSIHMDGTNGQITCHRAWGASRKWAVWNAYNRQRLVLRGGDSTASWSYTGVLRQSNNAAGNKVTVFCGLSDELVCAEFSQKVTAGTSTDGVRIGWDSTSVASGRLGDADGSSIDIVCVAEYTAPPFIGISNVNCLEIGNSAGAAFFGSESHMVMRAEWMG